MLKASRITVRLTSNSFDKTSCGGRIAPYFCSTMPETSPSITLDTSDLSLFSSIPLSPLAPDIVSLRIRRTSPSSPKGTLPPRRGTASCLINCVFIIASASRNLPDGHFHGASGPLPYASRCCVGNRCVKTLFSRRVHLLNAVTLGCPIKYSQQIQNHVVQPCAFTASTRPYLSSKRTISSSPRYVPDCTSITSSGVLPGFSSRCVVPSGMKVDWFSLSKNVSSPRVTRAVPHTTVQCSAR